MPIQVSLRAPHANADPDRYFTKRPQFWFSHETAHIYKKVPLRLIRSFREMFVSYVYHDLITYQ